ncbi:hypothetical protein DFJ74DRAFT_652635 [Hyaloraphidium curvatum]|nr:hypothetical protein DFJ74DRAFT_652635 [Hyaloraphidium curvatum]
MPGRLQDKIAFISGGASGCGAAAARLFAAEGASVGILDHEEALGSSLALELTAAGFSTAFERADVSVAREVDAAVAALVEKLGPPDVLFAHAGTIVVKPFLETSEEDFDRLFGINVKGIFLVTKAVLPHMLAQGKGSIVCTSSVSAVYATPNEVLYCATKGAVHTFARAIAVEYRDRGIRCNAVCPGFVDTPHGQREVAALSGLGVDVSEAAITAAQGRMGKPEDIARAALYLASDEASFVTGAHLFVDGGYSAV